MGKVRFEVKLTPQDFAQAMTLHYRPSRWIYLILALVAAFLVFLILSSSGDGDEYAWIPIAIPILIFVAFWVVLIWWSIRRGARNATRNAFLSGPIRGQADAWGMEFGGDERMTRYSWKMLFKAKLSPEYVVLYIGSTVVNVFPGAFFRARKTGERFESGRNPRRPVHLRLSRARATGAS